MKKSFVFTLILLILAACATPKQKGNIPRPGTSISKKSTDNSSPIRSGVLWDLMNAEARVRIVLLNLDNQKETQIDLQYGITTYDLPEGTWQMMGFTLNGKKYETLLSSQNFVFKAIKDKTVYAGSLVFQCPRVGSKYNILLKNHKFFNRYPFKNQKGLCELIVGNDFATIQKILPKAPKSSLILGL